MVTGMESQTGGQPPAGADAAHRDAGAINRQSIGLIMQPAQRSNGIVQRAGIRRFGGQTVIDGQNHGIQRNRKRAHCAILALCRPGHEPAAMQVQNRRVRPRAGRAMQQSADRGPIGA